MALTVFVKRLQLAVVAVNQSVDTGPQHIPRIVVDPCITARLKASTECAEDSGRSWCWLFVTDDGPAAECVVALVDPVAMSIWRNLFPVEGVEVPVANDPQLVLAAQVVPDVAVEDLARPHVFRILGADEDGDGIAATAAEDLAALLARQLPGCSLVTAKVVHVDRRIVVGQRKPHAVGSVAIDPAAVGHEPDDTVVADSVGRPSEGADVGVVEAVLVRRGRPFRIRLLDPAVQRRVLHIRVQVVGAALPHRVGRVADDDADRRLQLALDAFVVAGNMIASMESPASEIWNVSASTIPVNGS